MENIHTKVNCYVQSTFSHAWNQLWRKAQSPGNFIHGIQTLNILQQTDQVILRQMERITKDQQTGTVKFHNLPDSDIQGNIYNHILQNEQGKQGEIQLFFYSNAHTKDNQPFPPKQIFEKALIKTKSVIEQTSNK